MLLHKSLILHFNGLTAKGYVELKWILAYRSMISCSLILKIVSEKMHP